MATIITNYTTYDLAYYYADLRRLPRLSREERQHLVTGLSGVPTSIAIPQDDTQVKQRLIESYLPFAKHLAITLCPPTLYQRLLPELVGATNLAVVEATMRCDLGSTLSLDAYIAAYVRGAIKQTIVKDDVLTVPYRARDRARAEGTLDQLYAQHRVASLDELMEWFDTDEVEEPPVKPILPTEAAPARDPQQRASSAVAQPIELIERARLTLHETDPITGTEETLYSLFFEYYRGYTIYSTQEGRCCIHGKQGCIKLRGKFACFPDIEDAKTLIKRFRAEGYTSYDSVERYLPEWEFVCLNWRERQRSPMLSRPMQRVS